MKALELLRSNNVGNYFARMTDGSFRWVSVDLHLIGGGPDPSWVERGLRVKNSLGEQSVRRVEIVHDILLATLNARLPD